MKTEGTHTLTGAYALDALSGEEHEAVTAHLAECADCAREVREFAATAARLAGAVSRPPPDRVKAAVLARIDTVRQLPPRVPAQRAAIPLTAVLRRRAFMVAASLTVTALLGGTALWQYQRAEDARRDTRQTAQRLSDLTSVMTAPDARTVTGRTPGGTKATVIVAKSRDRAVFVAEDLPAAGAGKTYQLWYAKGDAMRPAGLVGRDGAILMSGSVGDASAVGLTLEPAGGSSRPTTDPLMVMALPGA
ncbi:anti-sigma factor [Streptomyces sp. CAU 1734]|uniref:anti-sigma factor n=1 Tax=Streptomyces sp. CAU 1734 TaxID=3140360 RepID=UPI003261ADB5